MTPVEEKWLAPEAAHDAIAVLEAHGITSIWVFTGRQWLVRDPAGDCVDLEIRRIQTPPTHVARFDARLEDRRRQQPPRHYRRRGCRRPEGSRRTRHGTAQPALLSRREGQLVDLLAARLAVPPGGIAVLGDMGNDVEMFARAGFAIAMGNATPEVKNLAHAVTLSNDEDGFAAAVDRYMLFARSPAAPLRKSPALSRTGERPSVVIVIGGGF